MEKSSMFFNMNLCSSYEVAHLGEPEGCGKRQNILLHYQKKKKKKST